MSDTDFVCKIEIRDGVLDIEIGGNIDELARFPEVSVGNSKKATIDLDGVRSINSIGIRAWLKWIRTFADQLDLVFMNCPKSIVSQFNTVDGFLPTKAKVTSFYVPFACEKCGYEKTHRFSIGKEVTVVNKQPKINFDATAAASCKLSLCAIEMDVIEAKYFNFLKRI